jgi:NDP-sugar pyrophosphorylase family protein
VAILAGGLATRLRPITEKIPKSLVTVAGKPFLEHQIRLLRSNGITELVLCLGYLGEMIVDQFGDGSPFGVRIRYSFDGPKLLGTGGAIRKALPMLPERFFILYGDSYLPIEYRAVANAFSGSGAVALMTVFANSDAWDRSNVWFESGRIRLYSKRERLPEMNHIDYGLTIARASAFEHAAESFDLAELLESLSRKQQLAGFEVQHRFYEVGSPAGLRELDELLSAEQGARSEKRGASKHPRTEFL